jgi:hypothetical protein
MELPSVRLTPDLVKLSIHPSLMEVMERMDMQTEAKTERFQLMFQPSLVERIDEWGWERRIRTRAETIRVLVEKGLEASASEMAAGSGSSKTAPAADTHASASNAG